MRLLSPLLTLVTLLIVPLMALGMRWITSGPEIVQGAVNGTRRFQRVVEETLSGQRIVKAFSQEKRVIEEFRRRTVAARIKLPVTGLRPYSGFIPKLMNGLNNLVSLSLRVSAAWLMLRGAIRSGLSSCSSSMLGSSQAAERLGESIQYLIVGCRGCRAGIRSDGRGSGSRRRGLREKEHCKRQLQMCAGRSLSNVSFSYDGDEGENWIR